MTKAAIDGLRKMCEAARARGVLPQVSQDAGCDKYMPTEEGAAEMDAMLIAASWATTALVMIGAAMWLHHVPPTRGRWLSAHAVFAGAVVAILLLTPNAYQDMLFSEAGVAVVTLLYPLLESVRAVATLTTDDDTRWLQYWISAGLYLLSTEWLDSVRNQSEFVADCWYTGAFFFHLWLQLPFTDGSTLLYDFFIKRFIVPLVRPFASSISSDSWITSIYTQAINGSHLYGCYMFFIMLPGVLKRFLFIIVGTAYPLVASITAVTTDGADDDTQWLLYWYVSLFPSRANWRADCVCWCAPPVAPQVELRVPLPGDGVDRGYPRVDPRFLRACGHQCHLPDAANVLRRRSSVSQVPRAPIWP